MKTTTALNQTVSPPKAYSHNLAMQINAQRAALAQPSVMSIGSTGLLYTRSMGGRESIDR